MKTMILLKEKPITLKLPFVLFKPIDSFNIYNNETFIFYYSVISISHGDDSLTKIDYTLIYLIVCEYK